MATNYYYFASTLPYLKPGGSQDMTTAYFLDACRDQVNARDFRQISDCELSWREPSPVSHFISRQWREFDQQIRNELVVLRCLKKGMDADRFRRRGGDRNFVVAARVREIFDEPAPLQAETRLFQLRWDFLGDLEIGHYFDVAFLIVYFLKLQLIERHSTIDKEKGKELLKRIRATGRSELKKKLEQK